MGLGDHADRTGSWAPAGRTRFPILAGRKAGLVVEEGRSEDWDWAADIPRCREGQWARTRRHDLEDDSAEAEVLYL